MKQAASASILEAPNSGNGESVRLRAPMSLSRVVMLDLERPNGHILTYLQYLTDYWCERGLAGTLDLIVMPDFATMHADYVEAIGAKAGYGVRIRTISRREQNLLDNHGPGLRRWLRQGPIVSRYLAELRPDACLFTHFDHVQLSLATGLRFDHDLRLAGIYFRPMFDYGTFGHGLERLQSRLRKTATGVMLRAALRNPHLKILFCLDPDSVGHVKKLNNSISAIALPDPVKNHPERPSPEQIKRRLGIKPGRQVLLLFGDLTRRKGTFQLLDALALLSQAGKAKVCLLMAGLIPHDDKEELLKRVRALEKSSAIQVVLHDRFVDTGEIQSFFDAAGLVLLPYQRQIGMSGILVWAAASAVPVLSSDYGLIGRVTKREGLGVTMDSSSPAAIAEALRYCISRPADELFNRDSARAFAALNSAENFAATIYRHLIPGHEPRVGC